ncbi:MAG: 1-(5-phosphoribosyl)-5-[(5-phosphoribosylamino)methylideneamino]imidazole-4-carboxamide isomerase [Clostridiales bacterium]|jgi:phosphoribosylformimino-5-aminoimidazole carboxamide ribotide isomerase|nr:1-(5-phosphoribosyl)-5-[(5-phosphoribosylamino)methylideneamino]imidazole-4-carboxamide isomerase [Clostridiales bacterium]
MILFPAVDILGGRCVRLLRGGFNDVTVYGDPVETALRWESLGAEFLHVVDLDGARTGEGVNLPVVAKIARRVKIPVQLGGGVRSFDAIKHRLEQTGVSRVILGTAALNDPALVERAVSVFGADKIVGGIDAKNGFAAVNGWVETSAVTAVDLGRAMRGAGLKYAVYTDISRDGALKGANVAACIKMSGQTNLNIIASGGVSSLADITSLARAKMYGAILGKALYDNLLNLPAALTAARDRENSG